MKVRWFVRLLVICLLASLAVTPAWAITYGQPDGEAHPYVGLVLFYDEAGTPIWRCSGTLLSPTVFLTAGHCTDGATSAQVWFDSEVTRESGYPFSGGVTGTPYTHPNYDDFATFPNTSDVGIVVLDTPVYLDEYGQLPQLGALDSLATQRGRQETTFTVVGYGLQSVKPKLQADLVRYRGEVSFQNLRSALTDGYNIQHSGSPGKGNGVGGTCFGDSGGPVFLGKTNIVVGITSFGLNSNCAGPGFAYRVDIANSLDFINQFL